MPSCKTYVLRMLSDVLDASVASKSGTASLRHDHIPTWFEANAEVRGQFLRTFPLFHPISSYFFNRETHERPRLSAWSFLPDSQATAMSTLRLERKPAVAAAERAKVLKHIEQTGWLFHYITPLLGFVRSCKPQLKAHVRLHVPMQKMCTLTHTQIPPRKAASPNASCSFAVASRAANRFQSMKRDLFEQLAYVCLH